ncbi:MAG: UDP-glucose dehydrogenase family protein [Myxococcota bacterium]
MEVAVVGTGYVGLVAGTCLAELGHRVTCVDKDADKVETLRRGGLPIYEPGLEEMVPRNAEAERLLFTTDLPEAVGAADVVFIAVGTPPGEDGSADLQYVEAVAEGVADALDGYTVVVVKSTVPVGTCERVRSIIADRTDTPFDVVSNPEFLREGVAVPDFMDPDRIVLGCASDAARERMEELYRPLTDEGALLLGMDVRSAELTKYASNAMLATRISFMNEIANLCERAGADVENVRRGMGTDHRIGPEFLKAGVGYGGSCFPKDVQALRRIGRAHGTDLRILDAVEDVNERQKVRLVESVREDFGDDLSGRTFALWGLAFKPDTDDMREAPSIRIVRALREAGATVRAYDPVAEETAREVLGDLPEYADDPYACLEGADALLLVTEWKAFREPDWDRVKGLLAAPRIYDGRNLWDPEALAAAGFTYRGIGRR